mmetsp:Transcript_96661/g.279039  ORF Transcript_96661/g.279039 Transcript_96661/m.279039 type:complete len:215 (+) Transcript_96661:1021-1665(+)
MLSAARNSTDEGEDEKSEGSKSSVAGSESSCHPSAPGPVRTCKANSLPIPRGSARQKAQGCKTSEPDLLSIEMENGVALMHQPACRPPPLAPTCTKRPWAWGPIHCRTSAPMRLSGLEGLCHRTDRLQAKTAQATVAQPAMTKTAAAAAVTPSAKSFDMSWATSVTLDGGSSHWRHFASHSGSCNHRHATSSSLSPRAVPTIILAKSPSSKAAI